MNSATIWLLLFQLTAIGTSGPWFVLQRISGPQGPDSSNYAAANLDAIRALPLSVLTSYVLLTAAMALPSSGPRALVSPSVQQVAIATWNVFPLFIALSQAAFQAIFAVFASPPSSPAPKRAAAISAIRRSYALAGALCLASHIAALTLTFSTVLFPALFTPSSARLLHPGTVFRLPFSHAAVPSLGAGALQFMQWDVVVGFAAVLVPAVTAYLRLQAAERKVESLVTLILKVLIAVVVLGPGVALLGLRWLEIEAVSARGEKKDSGLVAGGREK